MVRLCAFPNCSNKMTSWTKFSFHRLPLKDLEILKQWLVVLNIDPDEELDKLRLADHRICGAHFQPEDFFPSKPPKEGQKRQRLVLRRNAIPMAAQRATDSEEWKSEVNKRPAPEGPLMRSGTAQCSSQRSPADKLKLQVRIVLARITPAAFGHGLGSPATESEAQDNSAQNDRPSRVHTASGIKAGGVDRGVQVNLLHAKVCTETTDKSAPQYIVDAEAILQLMKTCPLCSKQCRCNKYTRGPYFIVYQSCYFCDYRRKWASQPEAINMNIKKRRALCPRQKRGPRKPKHWSQTGALKHQSQCPTTKLQT